MTHLFRRRHLLLIAFAATTISSLTLAAPVRVPPGLVNGQMFKDSAVDVRNGYVSGTVDGLAFGVAINQGAFGDWILPCIKSGMTVDQVRGSVDDFIQMHPETKSEPMNSIFYRSMMATCSSKGFKTH